MVRFGNGKRITDCTIPNCALGTGCSPAFHPENRYYCVPFHPDLTHTMRFHSSFFANRFPHYIRHTIGRKEHGSLYGISRWI